MSENKQLVEHIPIESILYISESAETGTHGFTFARTSGELHFYEAPTEKEQDEISEAILDGISETVDFVRINNVIVNTSHLKELSVRTLKEKHFLVFHFIGPHNLGITYENLAQAQEHRQLFLTAWEECKMMRAHIESGGSGQAGTTLH